MGRNWLLWTVAALLALAIGGSMFALGRMSGGDNGGERPKVEAPRLSEEEEEMLKIQIAAAEVKIEEAQKTADGWVVQVARDTSELDLEKLSKDAAAFFQDLARAGVEVKAATYVVRTSDLKDVWGHRMKDVSLLRIGLDRETFERINWAGFEPRNFPRVTEDFWMHDLVAQKSREQQAGEGGQAGGGQVGGQGGGQAGGSQ